MVATGLAMALVLSACGTAGDADPVQPVDSPGVGHIGTVADETPAGLRLLAGDHDQPGADLHAAIEQALHHDENLIRCHFDPVSGVIAFDPDWFSVSRYDIDDDGMQDWIVSSSDERGGTCDGGPGRWWLYRQAPASEYVEAGPTLLLIATGAVLELSRLRHEGLPDILALGSQAGDGERWHYRYVDGAYVDVDRWRE